MCITDAAGTWNPGTCFWIGWLSWSWVGLHLEIMCTIPVNDTHIYIYSNTYWWRGWASCPRKSGLTLTSWYPKAILFAQFFDYSTPRCYSFVSLSIGFHRIQHGLSSCSLQLPFGIFHVRIPPRGNWLVIWGQSWPDQPRKLMSRIHPIPWDYWSRINTN